MTIRSEAQMACDEDNAAAPLALKIISTLEKQKTASNKLGEWSGLTIRRSDLLNVTKGLRALPLSTADGKQNAEERKNSVIRSIQASGVSAFTSRMSSSTENPNQELSFFKGSIVVATKLEDGADHRSDDPETFYGNLPMRYAGAFIFPDANAKRPLHLEPIIVYGPRADEGTAVHEYIHALFWKERLRCYEEQKSDSQKSCPTDPRDIPPIMDSAHTTLEEDFKELEFKLSETLEELDVYTILFKEGSSLGLSQQAIDTARQGVHFYLHSNSNPSDGFHSLSGILKDFEGRLLSKASQASSPVYRALRERIASLKAKVANFTLESPSLLPKSQFRDKSFEKKLLK